MKKANKKIMAVILSVAIVLSSANWNAFAITPKDYTDNASTPAPAQVQNVSSSESSAEESSQAAPESSESEQSSEQLSEPIPQPEPTEAPVSVAAAAPAVQAANADVASVTVDGETITYASFEEAWTAANAYSTSETNRAKVTLLADIAGSSELEYEIVADKYITLDLNGYTLTGNEKTSVITVNGDFQLEDNSATKDGKITGGKATNDGGGVYVASGTFTMAGGSITGNTANTYGGGVYVDSGTFTMSGGSITGNTANTYGGGVCVYDSGTFEMIGGSITDNTASSGGGVYVYSGPFTMTGGSITDNKARGVALGGGVYVDSGTFTMSGGSITGNTAGYGGGVGVWYGTFTMSGGSITGNTAGYGGGVCFDSGMFTMSGGSITGNTASYGGGVCVWYRTFTVSGNVNITNNTVGENANNVYLIADKKININGSLGDQSRIGITMDTPGVFTESLGGNADAFTSDDASYNVFLNTTTKEAYLSTAEPKAHVKQGSTISGNTETFKDAWTIANEVSSSESDRVKVTLLANINESLKSTYEVAKSKYITLDLNNYTLKGNGATSVIKVSGDFQLEDSSATQGGKITGGQEYGGGGVNVASGTFEMRGGSITDNTARYGGGVGVAGGGDFLMTGGSITDNTATGNGGGVYAHKGMFEMTGGSITDNTAVNGGGGVCVVINVTFTMIGGSITGNTATVDGGGVYVGGTFKMSGNVTVTDNTADGNANNVHLWTGKNININGSLGDQSRIGITMDTPGVFTESLGGNAGAFTSDDASYNVFLNTNTKEAYLSTAEPKAHIQHSTISGNTETFLDAWTAANEVSSSESDRATVQLLDNIEENPAETYTVASGKYVTLDLNNYTLTGNEETSVITVNGDFRLEDTSDTKGGKITGGQADYGGGVFVGEHGSFIMIGGSITGNTATTEGGGVCVVDSGTFEMSGGSITGNTARYGGGVFVGEYGSFIMIGGSITGNTAKYGGGVFVGDSGSFIMIGVSIAKNNAVDGGGVYVGYSGAFTMIGGSITSNTVKTDGGGVCVYDSGTFEMRGGSIAGNTASSGGGVCVYDSGTFEMIGGSITGNTATFAGGVHVYSGNSSFTMSGGSITSNTASKLGGGVYAHKGTFEMTGGSITDNTASYGGGVSVYRGTFTMSGGSITGNTAGYGGGVCVVDSGTFEMRGGSITGNTAIYGGGVYVTGTGTFEMRGGSITGNTAIYGGGGVYVDMCVWYGTFEMSGGSITDNTAVNGGGVFVVKHGSFIMIGGSITGNTATTYGGGVYVDNGRFTMSGSVNITSNTVGESANNVYLPANQKINIDSPLGDQSRIGVTMQTPGVFTSGLNGNGLIVSFTSDDESYSIGEIEGEAALNYIARISIQKDGLMYTGESVPQVWLKDQATEEWIEPIYVPSEGVYTFSGLDLAKNYKVYAAKALGAEDKIDTGSIVSDAQKTATVNYNTVSFNMHDHGEAPSSQVILKGQKAEEPQAPTEAGYKFDGWYTDGTYETAWNFGTSTVEQANTELHAKWLIDVAIVPTVATGDVSVAGVVAVIIIAGAAVVLAGKRRKEGK